MKEANIQRLIMLETSSAGARMFRNNSGAYKTEQGHFVKYGVGNPGGSDLIGITPVTITADMVGKRIGVFTAIEVKTPKGRSTEDQRNFIRVIRALGGYAGVARSVDDALSIIKTGSECEK